MMNQHLIWMHHYHLNHPHVANTPVNTASVFIWDNHYFQQLNFSLKHLVFIYETLCELPVDIIEGEMLTVLNARPESIIYVAENQDPVLQQVIQTLERSKQVIQIPEKPFINAPHTKDFQRFSAYWRQVESRALSSDGGFHDKDG